MPSSRGRRYHAVRQRVAAQNAAEDVDQHGFDAGVGQQNAKGVLDLLGVGAAADVEEVGGLAACIFNDVHGGHGETCAVHHAGDVAIELDVVQAEARGFHFERIFFIQIAQFQQIFVAVEGVVVDVDFGVERENFAVFGEDERIDFGERAVDGVVGFRESDHSGCGGIHAGGGNAYAEGELARLEGLQGWPGMSCSFRINSGVLCATSSISMPPALDAMKTFWPVSRSSTMPR